MAALSAGPAVSLKWTAGLLFLTVLLVKHTTEGAAYGEVCALPSDCQGSGMRCSTDSLCVCADGYSHFSGGSECAVSKYPDQVVLVPYLTFSSVTKFETDMAPADLDISRYMEIKNQLEIELTVLFQNLTGFKSVEVTDIQIISGLLETHWTVRLNRTDPKFVGATPEQIREIVRPELEEASYRYKTALNIDTSRRGHQVKAEPLNKLTLGLGLGLSLAGVAILFLFVVAVTLRYRQRNAPPTSAKSISDQSSSCESGRSSKLEPDNYQYSVFMKDGFSIPPHYAKFSPPSVTESSSTIYAEINDKAPLHLAS